MSLQSPVPRPDTVTAEAEVRAHLDGLLQDRGFDASPRNRRFLSYVVEETLAGRADRLKAYTIAMAAFGRGEDFDPLTDPIVRIEAARLRRSLERYYLTAGKQDRLRIAIPKGAYAAAFAHSDQSPTLAIPANIDVPLEQAPPPAAVPMASPSNRRLHMAAALAAIVLCALVLAFYGATQHREAVAATSSPGLPALLILPFENLSGDPNRSAVALSLTYEVAAALTQIENVAVFGSPAGLGYKVENQEIQTDYTFMGFIQEDGDDVRVSAFVVDSRTGQYLHSWQFETGSMGRNAIQEEAKMAVAIRQALEKACTAGAHFDCRPSLLVAAR